MVSLLYSSRANHVSLTTKPDLNTIIWRYVCEKAGKSNLREVSQGSDVAPQNFVKFLSIFHMINYYKALKNGKVEVSKVGLGELGDVITGSPSNTCANPSHHYIVKNGKMETVSTTALPAGVVDLGNVHDMSRRVMNSDRRGNVDTAIATLADLQNIVGPGVNVRVGGSGSGGLPVRQASDNSSASHHNQHRDAEYPEYDDYDDSDGSYEEEEEPLDLVGEKKYSELMIMDRENPSLWRDVKRWLCGFVIQDTAPPDDWAVLGDNGVYPTTRLIEHTNRLPEVKLLGLVKMNYSYLRSEPYAHELTGHDRKGGKIIYGKLLDTLIMEHLPRKVDDNLLRYMYSYAIRHIKDHTAFEVENMVVVHTVEVAFQFLLKKSLDAPSLLGRSIKHNPDAFGIRLN